MQKIIKDEQIVSDPWFFLRPDDDGQLPTVPDDADVIVPMAHWLASRDTWRGRSGKSGVWLAPGDEPAELAPWLNQCPVVAVDFPVFTDGRGYSLARLLRERYSYAGEIRAVGDVWQDQIYALWLVGFDAFQIRPDKSLQAALEVLCAAGERYQSNYRQPEPLFHRDNFLR